jgi:hypothetical protein
MLEMAEGFGGIGLDCWALRTRHTTATQRLEVVLNEGRGWKRRIFWKNFLSRTKPNKPEQESRFRRKWATGLTRLT